MTVRHTNMNNTQPAQAAPPPSLRESALFSKAKDEAARPSFWDRFVRKPRVRDRLIPLYGAIVAAGRDPSWYREGKVPDTVTGRFDMISAVLAMVLIRLEAEETDQARQDSVWLTELFVEDMDESLHEIGIGEYVVGKHVGKMMGALGGRLGSFREAARTRDFVTPVRRNIYHEAPPGDEVVEQTAGRLERFETALRATPADQLVAGRMSRP